MPLLDEMRKDALEARKSRSGSAALLSTLLGEIDTRRKSLSPPRDLTEDECVAVVKKFLKGVEETLKFATTDVSRARALAEKERLASYLPKQMSVDQIRKFAAEQVAQGLQVGEIMKSLKEQRGGQYDGFLASTTVRSMISSKNESTLPKVATSYD